MNEGKASQKQAKPVEGKINKGSRKTLNLGRRQRKKFKNWNSFLPQVDVWKARVEATSRWSQIEQSWDDLDGLRNGSNSLDFNEFLRLMRLQREEELLRNSGLISIDRNVSVSMQYAACWSVCFGVPPPSLNPVWSHIENLPSYQARSLPLHPESVFEPSTAPPFLM